jgi:predicted O-methyltransferase YrrM
MTLLYRAPQSVIEDVLDHMKALRLIHPSAAFNSGADAGLRKEVSYRDLDFLARIGLEKHEEVIVDSALDFLRQRGLVETEARYDKQSFCRFREFVNAKFIHKSWTTITPVMERLFYMLASVKRPETMIILGCFWGKSLAYFAGPSWGENPVWQPHKIYGIDLDGDAVKMARGNFRGSDGPACVEILCEDALQAVERLQGPFDFVYFDVKTVRPDSPFDSVCAAANLKKEMELYLPLLNGIYGKLTEGAWIVAHDTTWFGRQECLKSYLDSVRDKHRFSESISFDVDLCGLELTIK